MLLSEPLASLITFFRTNLIKFFLKSQQMSDCFYHITESNKLNEKKKSKNTLIWPCLSDSEFLRRMMERCKHMYSAIYDVMKSYLTHVWKKKKKKKKCNGYITL